MTVTVTADACARTPMAVRAALQRRPDWLQAFERDWLSTADGFDLAALDQVVDKWFPLACACIAAGYLDDAGLERAVTAAPKETAR